MPIHDPVALTRSLIQHKTETGSCDPHFVPWLSATLQELGFVVSTIEQGKITHVAAAIGPVSAKLKLGFLGHYDTVPAGDGWQYPPCEAREVNGVIYGRGASDMKSGDAAMITAAVALATKGIHVTVLLPGDEETASEGMPALLDALPYRLDFCIGGEPTSKDELGDCLKVGRRGVLQGKIELIGSSGHAAYAERTRNIIGSLPAVIQALATPWNDSRFGVETTLAITNVVTDSTAINVIPSRVTLLFDARFAPQRAVSEIEAEIARRLDTAEVAYQVAISKRRQPYLCDSSSEGDGRQRGLIESAQAAVREVTGREPLLTCDGGTSDARFAAQRGIPTVEFGVPHGNMHGADEFVRSEDIERLERIYIRIGELLASRGEM